MNHDDNNKPSQTGTYKQNEKNDTFKKEKNTTSNSEKPKKIPAAK